METKSSTTKGPEAQKTAGSTPAFDDKFVLRELELGDYRKGYMELLGHLTEPGDVSASAFEKQFKEISKLPIIILVVEDKSKSKVVATSTLLIEPKFIHGCSLVGHIEDVVSSPDGYRGVGLTKKILQALLQRAKDKGCYKVILDCSDKNLKYYEKIGFKRKENCMAVYFDQPAPKM